MLRALDAHHASLPLLYIYKLPIREKLIFGAIASHNPLKVSVNASKREAMYGGYLAASFVSSAPPHSKTAKPATAPATAPIARGVAPAAMAFEVDDATLVVDEVAAASNPVGAAVATVSSDRGIPSSLAIEISAASIWLTKGAYCEGKAETNSPRSVAVGAKFSREERRAESVWRAWR
jgi:hypothetical protein